jgi:NitT/TauT family transport system permease protein
MQRFSYMLDIPSALAMLLTMSLMGLLLFTTMELLDRYVIFWKYGNRMNAVAAARARRFRARTAV